jgi:hypothetical protein
MIENKEIKTPLLIEDLGMMYPTETSKQKKRHGIFKCQCGNIFKAQIPQVKSGNTKSCGCYNLARVKEVASTHMLSRHRLYHTWSSIMTRCYAESHPSYTRYGARGISVCDKWKDVAGFIEDMYPTFKEGLTIDRIDSNGNYEPCNCRWATKATQSSNTTALRITNTSGYRGIVFSKDRNKWRVRIGVNNKTVYVGQFNTAIEAAIAYDKYVIENNLEHTINGVII